VYEPVRTSSDPLLKEFHSAEAEEFRRQNSLIRGARLDNYINVSESLSTVKFHFGQYDYDVIKLVNIGNEQLLNRFYGNIHKQNLKIVICYHGTNPINFSSIAEIGLILPAPGSGIKIAHGSSFGLGIFVATNPVGALKYTNNSNQMLVCVAAFGNRFVTTSSGTVLVITDNKLIVPLFIAHYKPRRVYGRRKR